MRSPQEEGGGVGSGLCEAEGIRGDKGIEGARNSGLQAGVPGEGEAEVNFLRDNGSFKIYFEMISDLLERMSVYPSPRVLQNEVAYAKVPRHQTKTSLQFFGLSQKPNLRSVAQEPPGQD